MCVLCSCTRPLDNILSRACLLLGSVDPGTNGNFPQSVPYSITPLKYNKYIIRLKFTTCQKTGMFIQVWPNFIKNWNCNVKQAKSLLLWDTKFIFMWGVAPNFIWSSSVLQSMSCEVIFIQQSSPQIYYLALRWLIHIVSLVTYKSIFNHQNMNKKVIDSAGNPQF